MTVPEGSTTATFDVDTDAVVQSVDVMIRASYNSVLQKARLTVVPTPSTISLVSLTTEWDLVIGGNDLTPTVTISSPAPAGGLVVTLSGSRAGLATVPASVTIPEGETSATFTVTTQVPPRIRFFEVTATYDGISRSQLIEVRQYPE